ncbi:MAG: tRNA (guanine(10)-N(2))-dimethyltransferase [Archaeoglobaceae archaeon]
MIREGRAEIFVDDVFYNPRMEFCRDMDMLIFSQLPTGEYLDALAATGVRGIRAALECGFDVTFNDKNWDAQRVIKKNLEHNGVEGEVLGMNAPTLMAQRYFQHVDLDPFGSPSEFVDSACNSATRYLSVTATDTAALCGSSRVSGLRKYSAFALKTDYYPEVGLRMLIGKIAREATKYDKGIEVLISWTREHYYRVHLKVKRSVSFAGKLFNKIGYLFHCQSCGRMTWASMKDAKAPLCECGSPYSIMGPLWLGELHTNKLVSNLVDKVEEESERGKLLHRIRGELHIPFHYDLHLLSKKAVTSPPKMRNLKEIMEDAGYKFSPTRFSGTSFKTDADVEEIIKLLKDQLQKAGPSD